VNSLLASAVLLLAPADDAKTVFFRDRITPILQRCVRCHGGDEPAGTLNLTTRAGALKGGETGPALKPGNAKDSLLLGMVVSKAMPPKNPLSPDDIALLRQWIEDGAVWPGTIERKKIVVEEPKRAGPDWWSLQPVRKPSVPTIDNRQSSIFNPIDAFISAKRQAEKMEGAPEADRVTLLRRVTFDLIGLPPTPREIEEFVNDHSPLAYEKVVERLLASPHHGERWGRHWLDVARFGESQGFERDKLRDFSWRYRDYVIRAFNEDKPYSRFVAEQIAGDVLEPVTPETIIATGFLVAGPWDEVGATQQGTLMRKRAREEELEDMVSATCQTFLGLTVNCARCHNHKFDPILQRDYYRIKAALEGVFHGDRQLFTPAQVRRHQEVEKKVHDEIARLEKAVAEMEAKARAKVVKKPKQESDARLPKPMARWSFEGDARDSLGGLHGTLVGGAVIEHGRLKLNGKTAFVRTAPLTRDLKAKTLEAWVVLSTLKQGGGGVMSVQSKDGQVFDAIVYGERQAGKWIAGSTGFQRTRDLDAAAETASPRELIHVAVVYGEDGGISVYRNGQPYGARYVPAGSDGRPRTYAAKSGHILFGMRHSGGNNAFLAGEIEEARLYDRALSAEEVTSSFRAGVDSLPLEAILAVMTPEQREQREEMLDSLSRLRLSIPRYYSAELAYAANPRTPEPTFVLLRGDIEKQGERVSAAGLSAIKTPSPEWGLAVDAAEGDRRLKLAEWIASADNPLTARVMANRVWQYHFGRGLVATPSDFGFNGGAPTHPELLDWLATELVRSDWSIKHLHRLIVTSATYRQSSRFDAKAASIDADNRWLWRFPPRRLEGEAVRDAMLAVSGELNLTMGGPSFRPFKVRVFNSNFYDLLDPEGTEFQRRTVYRMNVGSAKNPLLEAFDCPDPSVKTPQRGSTTTPLQALGLMNGSFVLRQAKNLAKRVGQAADPVEAVYRLTFGRSPSASEKRAAAKLVGEHGLESLCWVLLNASEFLYLR
jgi:hypothetical protein